MTFQYIRWKKKFLKPELAYKPEVGGTWFEVAYKAAFSISSFHNALLDAIFTMRNNILVLMIGALAMLQHN